MRLTVSLLALLLATGPLLAQDQPAPAAGETPPAAAETPAPEVAATPSVTEAPDAMLSAVASLPVAIGDVQVVGPWVDGPRRGVWRTVMTQTIGETGGNRFFVQQIEEGGDEPRVATTTEVTEIAEIDGAVVGYRTDAPPEGQEGTLTLFFDIVPLDGEISETYELFVTPGEPYRFGPATN